MSSMNVFGYKEIAELPVAAGTTYLPVDGEAEQLLHVGEDGPHSLWRSGGAQLCHQECLGNI